MHEYKIVVLGTMGAGKSTAIAALAHGHVVNTDVVNTDARSGKRSTTVAMDYADVDLPNGDRLRVFGTPGQERFSFIWPILLEGASGVVVMIDASALQALEDLERYLKVLQDHAAHVPAVIGLSKVDLATGLDPDIYYERLRLHDLKLAVIPVDARDADQMFNVLDVLISEIEAYDLASPVPGLPR